MNNSVDFLREKLRGVTPLFLETPIKSTGQNDFTEANTKIGLNYDPGP